MMPAVGGVLLLAASVVVFVWTLRRGVYRRRPYELFALVGGSVVLGLLDVLDGPAPLNLTLFGLELAAFAALVWYMGIGARFRRGEVSVKVGDRFPQVALADSEGGTFDSRSLLGKSTALYLFYRGNW